jgi:glycogen debranching enzyme
MGFYASSMLSIALELARHNSVYEDIASKFFEHFIAIADAMNSLGGTGLWDEEDGFYYDRFLVDGRVVPLRVRSMVGLVPLLAVEVSEAADFASLPEYVKRAQWFVKNRRDLRNQISHLDKSPDGKYWLLAMPSRDRLVRVLRRMLDEREFLSPFGIRSVSRVHAEEPFVLRVGDEEFRLAYEPGESRTSAFGGNSNWRGPIWFPLNYLMIQALRRLGRFYGDGLRVECPTGSGRLANLDQVADEVERRLASLFLADERGRRACGECAPRAEDLVLFHEYFDGDSGRGLGASHQTGWTALVVRCIESIARERTRKDR